MGWFVIRLFSLIFFLMIGRPPRSTLSSSSAASDVYKRQEYMGDIQLAMETFLNARQSWSKYYNKEIDEPEIVIPQFDKSLHQGQGDRVASKVIKKPQIIIFEGWFLGYRYNSDITTLLKEKKLAEEDYQFAVDMNEKLKDYNCLWDLLKELIILMPEKFEYSIQWRMEAEQKMKKIKGSGKTDKEIEEFVKYFFRSLDPEIFINDLIKKKQAKLVIKVNYSHEIADCQVN
eukprot:TRINITY_DN9217_c0_g1_i2.p1 TRINITY_DN9217_c0_g1~~TRINITY_DN9217_c0_g1_i2.p1  ORF type:complete len:231 (-),score=51.38 TRINITY_DN9217_c0_g1_i2:45-737(-)